MPRVKGMGKRRGRPKGSLNKATLARMAAASVGGGAQKLLADMSTYHNELESRLAQIQSEMTALSDAMAALGGARSAAPRVGRPAGRPAGAGRAAAVGRPGHRGARRGPRPAGGSLREHIERVVRGAGGPIRLAELTQGVVRSGYQTSSKNLSNQVSMVIADMVKRRQIKKVDRGTYAA